MVDLVPLVVFIFIVELITIVVLLPLTWIPRTRKAPLPEDGNLLGSALKQESRLNEDGVHAKKCLQYLDARRSKHQQVGKALEETFGFQKDSVANQLEHLESLLVWSITQRLIAFEGRFSADPVQEQSRVMATAIQALHDKILSRVATWRARGHELPNAPSATARPNHCSHVTRWPGSLFK
jgi:hypothetical protein